VSNKAVIHTDKAPAAIGPYSQAVKAGNTVYMSGQIPLDPETMELVTGDIQTQARRVFDNLSAVATASGGDFGDLVKVNIFLTDLANFAAVNEVMQEYFVEPYPARACVGVASLPKGTEIEIEGIMVL
jgi:reactive intermediate/imine deaminase